jgi:hypothetical protein
MVASSPAATVAPDLLRSPSLGSVAGSSLFEVTPDGESLVVESLGGSGVCALDVGESPEGIPTPPEELGE